MISKRSQHAVRLSKTGSFREKPLSSPTKRQILTMDWSLLSFALPVLTFKGEINDNDDRK